MKRYLITLFFISVGVLKAQTLTLPCSTINICLDQTVSVSQGVVHPVKNMVVRDFNNDGFDDVMIVDTALQQILIYKNNQTGAFIQTTVGIVATSKFNSADAGDFDGDGNLDVVVVSGDTLRIYRNNFPAPNFSFVYAKNFDPFLQFKNFPTYLKVGKLNSDMFDDIAMVASRTSSLGSGVVVMAFRNAFTNPTYSLVTDYTTSIAGPSFFNPIDTVNISIGNYDNSPDGANEIVIADKRLNDLMPVLKNNTIGAGTLTFQVINVNIGGIIPGSTVTVVQAESVDINNDGSNELLALARSYAVGFVFQGIAYYNGASSAFASYTLPNVAGTYQFLPISAAPATRTLVPLSFKMGDVNGDGFKDIIGMNNACLIIYLYKPLTAPNSTSLVPFDSGNPIVINFPGNSISAEEVNIGRFDNNGLIDIFYKSWKSPAGGVAAVIPNFSNSFSTIKSDSTICSGKTVTLAVTITHTIAIPHTIEWHKFLLGVLGTGPVFTASTSGIYFPIVKIPFPSGGGATCLIIPRKQIDSLRIKASPEPTLTVSDPAPYVCFGKTVSINASIQGTNSATYVWTTNGNVVSNTASLSTPAITTLTFYEVKVLDNKTQCTASMTVPMNVHPVNPDNIIASSNKICLGDSVKLSFPGATSYTWSVVANNSNDSIIIVKPITDVTYSLVGIGNDGCTFNKTTGILIDKECAIKWYNTVTPNGDNINDIWYIDNINRFPKNHVSIYNRWGQKVYFTENYNNENNSWPAKSENSVYDASRLIASTYYFVLDLGNNSNLIKGWIELIK